MDDSLHRAMLRALTLAIVTLALSACRIIAIVPQGGELHWQEYPGFGSPSLYCGPEQECTMFQSYPSIYGSFYAVPHAGWKFAGWKREWRHVCGPGRGSDDVAENACKLDSSDAYGHPNLEAMVADEGQYVIVSPIFVPDDEGQPISAVIPVAGREWAQPKLFTGLSWDGIMSVCPGGVCGPGAVLNGWDMEGWTLATVEDLNALANHYLAGEYFMGPGPDEYTDSASAMGRMITLESGVGTVGTGPFLPTPIYFYLIGIPGFLSGHTATTNASDATKANTGYFYLVYDRLLNRSSLMSTNRSVTKGKSDLGRGAFFYRIP